MDYRKAYTELGQRVREIALKLAPDYPDIETVDVWGCLWAIEQGGLGTQAANEDLHAYIRMFAPVTEDRIALFEASHVSPKEEDHAGRPD